MNAKADTSGSVMDTVKLSVAVAILAGAVGAFYWFSQEMLVIRVGGLLAAAAVSILIGYQTAKGQVLWGFVQESRNEVRKVVWPTRQETIQTTLVVVALVILTGVFMWLLDMLLGWGIQQIIGVGG
ncbi:MAG TPA: preprotein translocase subunit SecE [Gammaproteobacteria bacterium]|nr:preprotein translocase subunit SecE [Gammaproteobacteria bacterium]